jgi:hypothetical protein
MPNELLTKNVIFPETFFDESLSLEPVPVRWNLQFPRHLLETTHAWFTVVTIISKNIAPPFVHKFPFLIVYKKLRILRIGTHYGLSVWCVYTLAKSENKTILKTVVPIFLTGHLVIFVAISYIFPRFGIFIQEKSVNHAENRGIFF